jgi:uncharacterized membrane protein YhhN
MMSPATFVMIAATAMSAAACGLLVLAEFADDHARRARAKPVASLGFVVVGVAAMVAQPSACAVLIVVGQVLGAFGDLELLRSREPGRADAKRRFAVGVGLFLAGHLAYVVGFATVVSPLRWPRLAGYPMLILVYIATRMARTVHAKVDGPLKRLVPAYAVIIAVMVIGANAVAAHGVWGGGLRLYIGALMFFLSDLFVAKDLVDDDVWNRVWGLPLYYAGQLLMAWSIAG